MEENEQQASMYGRHRCDRAAFVAGLEVGTIHCGRSTQSIAARLPLVTFRYIEKRRAETGPPGALSIDVAQRLVLLLALLRPPPWLARPPLLAISRCFAGSIAAKPRFEPPPLFDPAMPSSLCATNCSGGGTQPQKQRFNSLT